MENGEQMGYLPCVGNVYVARIFKKSPAWKTFILSSVNFALSCHFVLVFDIVHVSASEFYYIKCLFNDSLFW